MKTIYRIISIILLAYLSPNLSGEDKSDSKTPLSEKSPNPFEKGESSERGIHREASQDKKIQGIGQLLLEAAQNSDLPKIESALAAGADINYADSENRTALYFAYEKEKTEIISYLKKNGARETNLTKLYWMEKNCAKEYGKQSHKGVIKETEKIQKEKIQYEALFQKEDKTLSLEQNTFLNIVYYRALAYMVLKEFKLAIPEFDFVIQKNKTLNVYVYLYYANALKESGNIKKAIQVLEDILSLYTEKDKANIYFSLGWYYYLENQVDKAIQASEESFKLGKTDNPDFNFLANTFNNSLNKFHKGDYESGWNWFIYSLNLSFKLDSETRKNLLTSTVSDFENLLKKKKEIKSTTLAANANTALWFLHKAKEEINTKDSQAETKKSQSKTEGSISNKKKGLNEKDCLSDAKDCHPEALEGRLYTIEKSLSETPFSTKLNPELKYLLAAYSSKVKNFAVTDKSLEFLYKEQGYFFYEKSKKDEDFQYYHEIVKKNQKGFYRRDKAKKKKIQLIVQDGHFASVNSVAFSVDGTKFISGSRDNTVILWDISGKLLHTFEGHSDGVKSVAFSPDGKKILSGSSDKTIKLWDISGKLLHTFEGHSESVNSVAFSPDGKKILSGSDDNTIKLWDISGKLLHTFEEHSKGVRSLAFSPDGKKILSGSWDKTIKLWDISGRALHTFEGHSKYITSVAFFPDGKKILSGSSDKTIKLWDISGKLLDTFEEHSDWVNSVAFSPDGKKILSGSSDSTIKLLDLSGKSLDTTFLTFNGHSDLVNSVAFSPDGKKILSGSDDNTIKLWDLSGKLLHTFGGYSIHVTNLALSPDGKQILSRSWDKESIKLWDISGKMLNTFEGHSENITSVDFSSDGKHIVSGSWDNTIKLWDLSGKLLHTFEGHSESVNSVAFSPDGKQILSGSWDKTIKLWDISGKLLHTFEGHSSAIQSVTFSPDGKQILSGSRDNTINLWDLSGKLLHTFEGHDGWVNSVAFSPDGKQILSGSADKTVKLWDISGKLLHMFVGHSSWVNIVAFSPDGKQILSGSGDNTINLWDLSGKLLHTFEGHDGWVNSVAFSPDGRQIVSCSSDNTIKLWDISGKLLHTFKGHTSSVNSVAFTPDGKFIVSGSDDTTIKIWDVEKRALVATLIAFKDGEGLVYTPDGRFDYTSGKVKDYVSYRKGNEFIDLSDMFNHFYEPGLLEKVLAGDATKGKQENTSLDEKFKDRPFIKVKNIDPQKKIKAEDNKRNLLFRVKDQGSGISEVMVYVNGHLLSGNWKDFSEDLEIDIPLVAGVNKVEIKAYNKYRIPKTYAMELTKDAAVDEVLDKPDLYLLAVGINEYKESKLKFSVNDAKVFASVIEKKSKGLFENVVVKSLLDKDASKRNIEDAISEIKKQAKAKDVVMLYFSGHGNTAIKENPLSGENPKLFYFVPADFGWKDLDMDSETVARNQGVDADYINKSISAMLPHKVVLILDACQSGDVQIAMRSGNKTKLARQQMERLANGTGRFILTSSAGNELSREIPTLGHGVFTYVLLQALEEADNDKSGDISLREIGRYIEDKFEEKTKPYLKDIIQSPSPLIQLGRDSASARVNDFPLVKSK